MILTEKDIDALGLASATKADVQCIESALLEKLRAGVELPEADVYENKLRGVDNGYSITRTPMAGWDYKVTDTFVSNKKLLAYGAAQRLAGRERAIEECAAECLVLHANGNYKHDTREDCHDAIRALAASPQEQT